VKFQIFSGKLIFLEKITFFFSFELGYFFEKVLEKRVWKNSFPLAIVGVFDLPPVLYTPLKRRWKIENLHLNVSRKNYIKNISKIKKHLANGDIYQANYTIKYKFNFMGNAFSMWKNLKEKQGAPFNFFIDTGDFKILSFSPEIFFTKNKKVILMKPMKGTAKRGKDICEDEKIAEFLFKDEKNGAENLMIVDLIRNDLGRVSKMGSVKVEKLFEIEKYNTLFQMTSTIKAKLKDNSTFELFRAIFPSGSVTGAPKIRAMQIIRDVEKEPRKIYTGAIGFFSPGGKAFFNVAIRTVLLEGEKGEMGVGSGIVFDSKASDEYEECKLKAKFLTEKQQHFEILETMLFENGNFKNLQKHLSRMKKSAQYFGFPFERNRILDALNKVKHRCKNRGRIRLLLNKKGCVKIEAKDVEIPEKIKIYFSKISVSSQNPFLYHKTTNRKFYDCFLRKFKRKGFYDVIFMNEKGEITEGARTNVYLEKKGIIYTPPLKCGLLGGAVREELIKKGRVREKVLKMDDFKRADSIYISNAIIGFRKIDEFYFQKK